MPAPQITPSLATILGEQVLSEDVLGRKSCVRVLAFGGERCPGGRSIAKWKHPQVHVSSKVTHVLYCALCNLCALMKLHVSQ